MTISVFDLFSIGLGPSSSHTVGPMRAARRFVSELDASGALLTTAHVKVELFGSLGATGRGHATDKGVLLGLEGVRPDEIDPDAAEERIALIGTSERLRLLGRHEISMRPHEHLIFHQLTRLPQHPNGLRFSALDAAGKPLLVRAYFSVGGGFVVSEEEVSGQSPAADIRPVPHPFASADELIDICRERTWPISQVMLENELVLRTEDEVFAGLARIWHAMRACVERGLATRGILPGPIKVERRAPALYQALLAEGEQDPLNVMDYVNVFALAVSEENAAGSRVVTAPTNGAAGIIPAVMTYCHRFRQGFDDRAAGRFLLTAAAIGSLYKRNASISGAEVGCQGEIGVACSMAAAGLAEFLGGSPEQVENAAEVGMEHHLGLTCDPIGGLVQVPCIERNAMGAVTAVNAARIALRGDGRHVVSLDNVIKTMRQTGADMNAKYKETAQGGLAVNVIEC